MTTNLAQATKGRDRFVSSSHSMLLLEICDLRSRGESFVANVTYRSNLPAVFINNCQHNRSNGNKR